MAIITNKSIFYHIPKTGGTWVSYALKYSMRGRDNFVYKRPRTWRGRGDSDHYWERTIAQLWGLVLAHSTQWRVSEETKKGLFSFAFVREPVSWYKSYWAERVPIQSHGKPWKYFLLDFAWDINFEKFVENALEMFPEGPVTTLYKCFLGKNGDMLDFVGRQENLREDLIKALTLAGEDFNEKTIKTMKRVNAKGVDKDFNISIDVSSETREAIEQRERWVTNKFYKK